MRGPALFAAPLLALLLGGPAGDTKEFTNPILPGFYPDPSICRVGGDYYLVNSSFAYFPGIPIFHSRDLVSWRLIGHVMDRPGQLNLDSLGVSRGIFAPAIRYHNGVFYVTCTLVDRGGNFIVTSPAPSGPWSDPVWLPQVNGIDPSLFFDDDGRAYLIYNSEAPDNRPLYDGHRTIRMYEFDPSRLAVAGDERILVNGGTDISRKPVWIEGPHIFRKNGFYYLIAAEGGTGDRHSEVVFRSAVVGGPYVPYEKNPILTQRDLDPKRTYPITSTGHADFVETKTGTWWAVFLGCRPYPPAEEGFYNTGRETFLAPVGWENDWPVVNPGHEAVQYTYPLPDSESGVVPAQSYSGNYSFRDEFSAPVLRGDWEFLRTPREKWYSLSERPGYCALQVRPEACSGPVNPSFIGLRQSHATGTVSVSLDFRPASANEKAGLLVFQNERRWYFLCRSRSAGAPAIELFVSADAGEAGHDMRLLASASPGPDSAVGPVALKIGARGSAYDFFYSVRPGQWRLLKDGVPASFLSTKSAGGFVGCMYAMYATSLGSPSSTTAYFDWCEYRGNDEVYK